MERPTASKGAAPWIAAGIIAGALVPLAAILVGLFRGTLGANPVAEALNQLGLLALVMLSGSLACTPLRRITGASWPGRLRRPLGLLAFAYASLHMITYVGLDQLLDLRAIVQDVLKRPFITVGALAFVVLVPLAVTSTAGMQRRLGGARWRRLHRLAYVASVLAVVHFFLRVKKDVSEPLVYGSLVGALLAYRLVAYVADRSRARRRGSRAPDPG
jgi:sulfoxide reductase heme-binding subunit YedZ